MDCATLRSGKSGDLCRLGGQNSMADVTRTGVSIEPELLEKFDRFIAKRGYKNRSMTDGVTSPLGWLWHTIIEKAAFFIACLIISLGYIMLCVNVP